MKILLKAPFRPGRGRFCSVLQKRWFGRALVYNRDVLMRKTEKSVLAAAFLIDCSTPSWSQATDDAPRAVYRKTADSVIAVRAMAPLGERSGSGVILSKEGLL